MQLRCNAELLVLQSPLRKFAVFMKSKDLKKGIYVKNGKKFIVR